MWKQVAANAAPNDPAAAKLDDDGEIIVVVDSQTGEVRQCGNMTGYCVGMSPWSTALATAQTAPLHVGKHAAQLNQETAGQTSPATH